MSAAKILRAMSIDEEIANEMRTKSYEDRAPLGLLRLGDGRVRVMPCTQSGVGMPVCLDCYRHTVSWTVLSTSFPT